MTHSHFRLPWLRQNYGLCMISHEEDDDQDDYAGDGVDVGVDEGEEAGPAALEVVGGVVRPSLQKPTLLGYDINLSKLSL